MRDIRHLLQLGNGCLKNKQWAILYQTCVFCNRLYNLRRCRRRINDESNNPSFNSYAFIGGVAGIWMLHERRGGCEVYEQKLTQLLLNTLHSLSSYDASNLVPLLLFLHLSGCLARMLLTSLSTLCEWRVFLHITHT